MSVDVATLDAAAAQRAIEYAFEQGWTDGLPIVPATDELLEQFLATTPRPADELVCSGPQWDASCTVAQAAVNAIMSGCRPEYFPVVLAALEALWGGDKHINPLLLSTTGSAPLLVVNGPIRRELDINCEGSLFGSGFRANATIGRALRLIVLNVFAMRPHEMDQACQASPIKSTCCIGENEEQSPWEPLHVELGFSVDQSTVAAVMGRGTMPVENRYCQIPEKILQSIAEAMAYGGAQFGPYLPMLVVMGPEHAQLCASRGWSKQQVKQYLFEHYGRTIGELKRMGKGYFEGSDGSFRSVDVPSRRLMAGTDERPDDHFWHFARSVQDIMLVVAGANVAGMSTVVPPIGRVGNIAAV